MPRLAIVGTEGTGKTVLVAALARYLSDASSRGIEPKDAGTQRYVSSIWNGLSNQTWPPATEHPVKLSWLVRTDDSRLIEFRWLDPPGREVRGTFGRGDDPYSQSAPHGELSAEILSADIVLVLLNLADFVGEPDVEWRDTTELAIRFFLKRLSERKDQPSVAVVMSQADLYPQVVEQLGAKGIIAKYLPSVARSMDALAYCDFLAVSAIQKTEIKVDAEGHATRLPSLTVESEGIDGLAKWVIDRVTEDNTGTAHASMTPSTRNGTAESLIDCIQPVSQVVLRWLHGAVDSAFVASLLPSKFPLWKLATAAIIFGIVYIGCMVRSGGPKPKILSTNGRYERVGVFDYDGIVSGNVRNDGSTGVVTLQATWNIRTQKWTRKWSQSVPSGETVPFTIRFTEYSLGEATYEVQLVQK